MKTFHKHIAIHMLKNIKKIISQTACRNIKKSNFAKKIILLH